MQDDRTPEHKAIRAGVEALTKALPGRMSMYRPGDFEEHPYGIGGAVLYRVDSTYKADSQRDGTDDQYEIKIEIVKSVDSKDSYWRVQLSDRSNAVVINGVHYRIGPPGGEFQGFGGRRYDIEFLDGRRVTTYNLWYQGLIPPKYLIQLPDNARWVHPEQEPFGGREGRK